MTKKSPTHGFIRTTWSRLAASFKPLGKGFFAPKNQSPAQREHLGIESLPDGIGYFPTDAPAALVMTDEQGAALWIPTLISKAVAQGPVFLVAAQSEWVDRLLDNRLLEAAFTNGLLRIWIQSSGLKSQISKHGLRTLRNELEQEGLRPVHALYVIDAYTLLEGLSVRQLNVVSRHLNEWCLQRKRSVVLGFIPPVNTTEILPLLRNMGEMSMHIATLSVEMTHGSIHFERWNSDKGALLQTSFGLTVDSASGQLFSDGTQKRGVNQELLESIDQWNVIATRAAVDGQRGIPAHWIIVDSYLDIENAAHNSIAATILLDAGTVDDFERRTHLVFHLRKQHPPSLKIVVRENQGKLRTHSELALLRLGANTIIYKELGFSRLLQLLKNINAQSYPRSIDIDYDQTLAAFMPAQRRGYQTPSEFIGLVESMLQNTQAVGLLHSIVCLTIQAQVPHVDVLRACIASRNGDLITADQDAIYVFLFACREPDIDIALSRLFTIPLAQLFSAQVTDCSHEGIRLILKKLQTSASNGLPDYHNFLPINNSKVFKAAPGSDLSDKQKITINSGKNTIKINNPEIFKKHEKILLKIIKKPIAQKIAVVGKTEIAE